MNYEYLEYMNILQAALGFTVPTEHINWESVEHIANKQATLPLIYHGLWKNDLLHILPAQLKETWYNITCCNAMKEASKCNDLARVLDAALQRTIRMVCFKGNVIAQTYPEWKTRLSSDADIFVFEQDKERAKELLLELGYCYQEEHSKELVPVYVHPFRNHMIELHFSLWEDYEGSQIDKLDRMELTRMDSLMPITIGGIQAWTLSPTNHLIFQMFHIIKHFIVQGVGMKYMLDISFFVNQYQKDIDFPYFWNCMESLHYQDFCICYLSLCEKYLGMDATILTGKSLNNLEKMQERLLSDFLDYGNKESLDYNVITLMSPYLEGRDSASGNAFTRKLQLIFPKADVLQDDFAYAKRHHILLPLAWIHKWCRFIVNRITGKSKSAASKLTQADARIAMMQDMNLL